MLCSEFPEYMVVAKTAVSAFFAHAELTPHSSTPFFFVNPQQFQSLEAGTFVLPVKTWHNGGWEVLASQYLSDLCQTHFLTH